MSAHLTRAATVARLARWLGPWTPDDASPRGIVRQCVRVDVPDGEPFDAWIYGPRDVRPRGALFVVQGLHFLGPADARLDRFCRILAGAGIITCAPFLPTFGALRVGPRVGPEALAAYDAFEAWLDETGRPSPNPAGVFSISAGSLPAAYVCARRSTGPWVVFGGYRDFGVCIRFSLGAPGDYPVPPDPLNRPAVHLNLMPFLPDVPVVKRRVEDAVLRFVEQTWGRPEMKVDGAYQRVAMRLLMGLPEDARLFFRRATGLSDRDGRVALAAFERAGDAFSSMDPGPYLEAIDVPVIIVHGRDDDVIPLTEAFRLRDALAPHTETTLHVTGLYGHTGSSAFPIAAAARELRAMVGIVEGIVSAAGV